MLARLHHLSVRSDVSRSSLSIPSLQRLLSDALEQLEIVKGEAKSNALFLQQSKQTDVIKRACAECNQPLLSHELQQAATK